MEKSDKILAYKICLARLSFQTRELKHFDETEDWIEQGFEHFINIGTFTKKELRNIATAHVIERWEVYKRAGNPVTGGLVRRMTITYLKKYIAKDKSILSNPHPERSKKRKYYERLAVISEEKLSWKERQFQEDLKLDLKRIERESLSPEGKIVLNCKREGMTNSEIVIVLKALGYRSLQHLLYKEFEHIEKLLRNKGYQ
jgi:hypothetical protein